MGFADTSDSVRSLNLPCDLEFSKFCTFEGHNYTLPPSLFSFIRRQLCKSSLPSPVIPSFYCIITMHLHSLFFSSLCLLSCVYSYLNTVAATFLVFYFSRRPLHPSISDTSCQGEIIEGQRVGVDGQRDGGRVEASASLPVLCVPPGRVVIMVAIQGRGGEERLLSCRESEVSIGPEICGARKRYCIGYNIHSWDGRSRGAHTQ